jgi:hypothetical protein
MLVEGELFVSGNFLSPLGKRYCEKGKWRLWWKRRLEKRIVENLWERLGGNNFER